MNHIAETFAQYVLPTYGRFPLIPEKGKGSYLWDSEGNKYLDFCTGIAVCSIGHCHPRQVEAIQKQAASLLHCSNLYQIPQQAELAKVIVEDFVKLPGKIFFSNSGAESNEGLIKLARRFGNAFPAKDGSPRHEIITFGKSFHGRTMATLTATGQEAIQENFSPLVPGAKYAIYNDFESVEKAITPHTAAIMLEPIQGEGGIFAATPEFLRGLKTLCDKHNLLLFFDEIQAGFGRTGETMAWRSIAPEIEPDGISWAKGLGGGFPIGAFWSSDRKVAGSDVSISSLLGPKSHGTTYGGNPLASAAALAVLYEIKDAELCKNATQREAQIRTEVAGWVMPCFKELRGKGLMLGFGLHADQMNIPEGSTAALHVVNTLMSKGILTVPAGAETVRWLPPLNVSEDEVFEALQTMKEVLQNA
ncbi:acetylornithine aminotransferase [Rubritalea halochordaticola]|uniref:Acetylornithine aminotransferase n=1 Tax=Rubritalea halochordaticola TaxID=714537 RepID=A0ABP9V1Q7_9BACT